MISSSVLIVGERHYIFRNIHEKVEPQFENEISLFLTLKSERRYM